MSKKLDAGTIFSIVMISVLVFSFGILWIKATISDNEFKAELDACYSRLPKYTWGKLSPVDELDDTEHYGCKRDNFASKSECLSQTKNKIYSGYKTDSPYSLVSSSGNPESHIGNYYITCKDDGSWIETEIERPIIDAIKYYWQNGKVQNVVICFNLFSDDGNPNNDIFCSQNNGDGFFTSLSDATAKGYEIR